MRRTTYLILVAGTLVAVAECSDGLGLRTPDNAVGVIVSAPVRPGPGATGSAGPASTVGGVQVVYVSLQPGSVPMAERVTITNQANGLSVTTRVVNGGFDPVPIVASVGDTLAVELTGSGAPIEVRLAVAAIRPLKVVRTSPPSGGRDVPLNAIITALFSEPIDAATLTTGAVQLLWGTTPVAGTVRFGDSTHLSVEFQPADLLAPQTIYRLVVAKTIGDVTGVVLDSVLDVPFMTGTSSHPVVSSIWPGIAVVGGAAFTLTVFGDSFVSTSVVTFGGSAPLTTYVTSHELTATIPAVAISTADTAAVSVTNPGVGTSDTIRFPIIAPLAIPSFASVSAGGGHSCGVTPAGAAYCWGLAELGELGDGTTSFSRTSPGLVQPYNGLPSISFATVIARARHTCGITPAGVSYCWGYGPFSGGYGPMAHPYPFAPGLILAALSAGGEDSLSGVAYNCGVTSAGAAYCLGGNSVGQLGDGTTAGNLYPVAVLGGLTFAAVSAGGESTMGGGILTGGLSPHTCGVTTGGTAYCWGDNSSGQLGDGTTTQRTSPVAVLGGLSLVVLSAGGAHTCGVTTAGAAYCWGANSAGQLGDGTTTPRTTAVAVMGGLTFATLSAGGAHTCGVTTAGAAYCWGDNSTGALGNGSVTAQASPVAVLGGLQFAALSAGAGHTCGVTTAGAAYCWGANNWGQLGDGTATGSSVPVKVFGQP